MYRLHTTSANIRDYAARTLSGLTGALLEVCQVVRISVGASWGSLHCVSKSGSIEGLLHPWQSWPG